MGEPVIHHRSPDFKAVFAETRARLRQVFRTENEVLLFTASGTGAFESAVANLLSPGEKVLAVSHGNFGTRWQKMAAAFGCDVVELTYDWGTAPRAEDVSRGSRREWREGRAARALGDLDGRRLRHSLSGRRLQRCGRDLGRRRDLESRRGPARDRCLGDRRRRHRVAEGADDAAWACIRLRLRPCLGEGRSRRPCRGSTGTGCAPGPSRRRTTRCSPRLRRPWWPSTLPSG